MMFAISFSEAVLSFSYSIAVLKLVVTCQVNQSHIFCEFKDVECCNFIKVVQMLHIFTKNTPTHFFYVCHMLNIVYLA